jgi:hypothetical protein
MRGASGPRRSSPSARACRRLTVASLVVGVATALVAVLPAPVAGANPPCAAGTYSATGNAPCTPAPAGSYDSGTGNTSATPCSPGYDTDGLSGATACTPAPAGSADPGSGDASATPCAAGQDTDGATGATACTPAPPGSYDPTAGDASATPCAAGTYSASPGAVACTLAPVNTYVATTGATEPTNCPVGTSNPNTGSTSEAACIPNPTLKKFKPAKGRVGKKVTITGTNLSGALSVKFSGVTAVIMTDTATKITTKVPPGATTGFVTVTTDGGTVTSAKKFKVT